MKPDFALRLDHDAVDLLVRVDGGWTAFGHADLSDPQIGMRLADLRDRAAALAPEGFQTKLILPASQILYTVVDAPGPDDDSRRTQIAAALVGRTPYEVADLAFDWVPHRSRVQVAVVARITLSEAEDFAEDHGFHPVSFVALPGPDQFSGEPFFGLTSKAASHLPAGATLIPDIDSVRIVEAPLPVPSETEDEPVVAEEDAPEATVPDDGVMVASAEPSATAGSAEDAVPDDDEAGLDAVSPDPEPEPVEKDDDEFPATSVRQAVAAMEFGPATADPEPDGIRGDATIAASIPEADDDAVGDLGITGGLVPDTESDLSELDTQDAESADPLMDDLGGSLGPDPLAAGDEAPFIAVDDLPDTAETADLPSLPVGPAVPSFASRRLGPAVSEREGGPQVATSRSRLSLPQFGRLPTGVTGAGAPADDSTFDEPSGNSQRPRTGLARALRINVTEAQHGTQAQLRARRDPPIADATNTETNRPNPFGAPIPSRNAPPLRLGLGLILVAALVIGMAAVALWSLWVTSSSDVAGEIRVADAPVGSERDGGIDTATATIDGAVPSPAESGPVADPTTPGNTAATPEASNETTLAAGPIAGDALAEAADQLPAAQPALPAPAADTIWPTAPETVDARPAPDATAPTLIGIAPSSVDGAADIELPPPESADADLALEPQPAPPPPGTEYTFDDKGQIVATDEGVRTPDGFMLYAGRPPVTPVPRPAALAPVTADPATEAPVQSEPDATAPEPEAALPADPEDALPVPAAAPSGVDDPLPPPVDPAHAAVKPRARPDAIVAATQARIAQEQAEAEALAAAIASAAPQAVATSLRPEPRPAGLKPPAPAASPAVDDAVAAAVAASLATPDPAPAPEPEPSAPQVEIDEPEPVAAVPNMPTSVTVAKQATIKNAVNLRDISLIGVYGSSASRRALVRMPNGRYVKLKIGDRFDGGQVAAIGDSELSYIKRGKTVVLRMLKDG